MIMANARCCTLKPIQHCKAIFLQFKNKLKKDKKKKKKSEREVAQSCPTPGDPMDCSLPGSSVHGIFQARVLNGVLLPSLGERSSDAIRD